MITAVDLARLRDAAEHIAVDGRFGVEPNPLVGCILYRGDRRIATGRHLHYGGAHAEVNAICEAGRAARGTTAYVTLEPCTTTGKTGPCVEALAKAGVARVVWAVRDPNPAHAGKAAAALRARGIVADGPAFRVDPFPWLTTLLRRSLVADRPWVLAKWATSLDGRLAFEQGRPASLSGQESWRAVHELRGRVEAVAVGVGTVLADDPRLECRLDGGPPDGRAQPAAVVFDSRLRTPLRSQLVRGASLGRPLHLYVAKASVHRQRQYARLKGVTITAMPGRDRRVDLARALAHLRAQGCHRLLVEGGGTLLGSLFRARLVDQIAAIVAPVVVGRTDAPSIVMPLGDVVRRGRNVVGFDFLTGRPSGNDVWIDAYVRPTAVAHSARVGARRVSAGGRS